MKPCLNVIVMLVNNTCQEEKYKMVLQLLKLL
jgi:hypothetical protein